MAKEYNIITISTRYEQSITIIIIMIIILKIHTSRQRITINQQRYNNEFPFDIHTDITETIIIQTLFLIV